MKATKQSLEEDTEPNFALLKQTNLMDTQSPPDPLDPNTLFNRQSPIEQRSQEKALPTPPSSLDRTDSEALVPSVSSDGKEPGAQPTRPQLTGQPSFQRPRKRVIWRNKACIIALPLQDEHGRPTNRQDYLKPEEVQRRLEEWERTGFNTQGFVLASPSSQPDSGTFQGQSRAVHPDPEDERRERSRHNFRVSVPDKQEWEAYVYRLKEEKLRALGVTFSDEEPPSRKSPAPSLMSRQASSQSSVMPLSPLLAAPPALSNGLGPTYQLGVNGLGKPGASHFPRYTVAMPLPENSFPHPTHYSANQSPIPRNQSPLDYISSRSTSRIGSPRLNEVAHMRHVGLSPANATGNSSNTHIPLQALGDRASPMSQLAHQQFISPYQQQQSLKPRPRPNIGAAGEGLDIAADRQNHRPTEIVTPTPRGHKQNPSENLQREIDEAEAYLERANGLEPPYDVKTSESSLGVPSRGVAAPPATTTIKEMPDVGAQTMSDHGSKRSVSSKLNVNAPEFKFQPNSSLHTQIPSMNSNRKASATRPSPKLNAAAPACEYSSCLPFLVAVHTVQTEIFLLERHRFIAEFARMSMETNFSTRSKNGRADTDVHNSHSGGFSCA